MMIEELGGIVGTGGVSTKKKALEAYASDNSFTEGLAPSAIVSPVNVDQVMEIIKLAAREKTGLVTCSSAPPRFRGDTVPQREGSVVVDLTGMDRIIKVDRRNKVALVEPGVTFGRLAREVAKEGLKVLMPLLPREGKSVVASYLEREPILIPKYHWDVTDPLLCAEVIFGTGDMFRTGSAAGPGDLEDQWASERYQKNPMGPGQSDLIRVVQGARGTVGIVTWASVRLEPLPTRSRTFIVAADSFEELLGLAHLMLRRKLGEEFLMLSGTDLAAIVGGSRDEIEKLKGQLPPWSLIYRVAGFKFFASDRVSYQVNDIGDLARAEGLEPCRSLDGVSEEDIGGVLDGPSGEPYWKFGYLGGFADIFFIATLEMVPSFLELMEEEAKKAGYPAGNMGTYVQPIQQGRSCQVEFTLYYDEGDDGERQKVRGLCDSAIRRLMDGGAFFSRPFGPWYELPFDRCPDTAMLLGKIGKMLDPEGILNPGKIPYQVV